MEVFMMIPCLALSKHSKPIFSIFSVFVTSLLTLSLVLLLYAGNVYSGQAILSWNAPTTNEDGTPLTDLAGYKIYYGTATGNYTYIVDVGKVTTYTFTNLADGLTYYFVATSYNAARFESNYSNEVSKSIPSSIQTYALTVSKAGTGTGSVSSAPTGITCGADCSESYNPGSSVTMTVLPDTSSIFTGWSGACSSTGNCSVTMDAAKSVTATFALKTYAITASAGTGGSMSPNGTVPVNYGANQLFTITPDVNYTIGDVVVDGSSAGALTSYSLTNVKANHTISVSFTPNVVTDLPKSGQTSIYASGDDGYYRSGTEWPAPRFTDNKDGTVTDNLTGLMWLKDGGCIKNNWSSALNTIAGLNNHTGGNTCIGYTADHTDWRLPNIREIESLVNYGVSDQTGWLNSQGFTNVKYSSYWSSTTSQMSSAQAWMINMQKSAKLPQSKKSTYYAWPVRGGNVDGK
jgi:hypothetical protein